MTERIDPKDCAHADAGLSYVGEWNEVEHAPSSHLCTRCKTSVQRVSPVGGLPRRPFTANLQHSEPNVPNKQGESIRK